MLTCDLVATVRADYGAFNNRRRLRVFRVFGQDLRSHVDCHREYYCYKQSLFMPKARNYRDEDHNSEKRAKHRFKRLLAAEIKGEDEGSRKN